MTLVVPSWALSPALGVQCSKISMTNGIYGLSPNEDQVSYRGGIDYQASSGFSLGLGLAYSPKMPQVVRYQPYLQIGWMF